MIKYRGKLKLTAQPKLWNSPKSQAMNMHAVELAALE
jgi:hypothetical protein